MEAINPEIINEIISNVPILNDKITNGINEFKNYLKSTKNEVFDENLNETEDESIKKAEGILDRLNETLRRNELLNKKVNETFQILNRMTDLFGAIIKIIENEKRELSFKNNELIDILIDLERRKAEKLILQQPKRMYTFNGIFEDLKNEWNEHKIKLDHEFKIKKQIEGWTGMKVGNVIFDSNVDDWNYGTSVFGEKITNSGNLIFLIEDTDGNLFGGYVNAKINKYQSYINDPKSFVFSLKSNGRLNGMFKFNIKESQYAFYLFGRSDNRLFMIGIGICICKENYKNQSNCNQVSYEYKGIKNALCGKTFPDTFKPTRITVIQLI